MSIAEDAAQLAETARKLHRQSITKASVDAAMKSSTLPAAVGNTNPREILEDAEQKKKEKKKDPPYDDECIKCQQEGGHPGEPHVYHDAASDDKAARARHAGRRS